MTPQEQADNERIAEFLEPKATLPPLPDDFVSEFIPSPKSCWLGVNIYEEGDDIRWIAANFHGSESANAILRDAMPNLSIEHRNGEWYVWPGEGSTEEDGEDFVYCADYKRAIVGAFLKFMEVSKCQ